MSLRTALLVVFVIPLVPAAVLACEPVGPPSPHVSDPRLATADASAPTVPEIALVRLTQDHGSPRGDSCGDISALSIALAGDARDDRSPSDRIGYQVTVEGPLPSGLVLPSTPFRRLEYSLPDTAPQFTFTYGESNEDVRFSLRVAAVDEAGNVSAPSAPYLVTGEAGCSMAPAPTGQGALAALAFVCLILGLAGSSTTGRRRYSCLARR